MRGGRWPVEELGAPIDRIVVAGDRVHCWAKTKRVSPAAMYAQGDEIDPVSGRVVDVRVGSGSWQVTFVAALARGVIARLGASFARGS